MRDVGSMMLLNVKSPEWNNVGAAPLWNMKYLPCGRLSCLSLTELWQSRSGTALPPSLRHVATIRSTSSVAERNEGTKRASQLCWLDVDVFVSQNIFNDIKYHCTHFPWQLAKSWNYVKNQHTSSTTVVVVIKEYQWSM